MRRLVLAALGATFALAASAQEAIDLFVQPGKGHCIACHALPEGSGPSTRNDVGPKLEGARMRELGRDAIREIIGDMTQRNPDTVMPPFGRHRILTKAEIERLTEFLHALP